jgi:hypothetical protein
MNRSQLEHIIRAAGSIADDKEIVVLGSTSILAQFPGFPESLLLSVEADVFPKNRPDMVFRDAMIRSIVVETGQVLTHA